MSILDEYVLKLPCAQNVIDIFAGEWSSTMPEGSDLVSTPGTAKLFDMPFIHRAGDLWGGFVGQQVLELGPLEGGHSYMLQQAGANRVVSIEANTRAFLKCLCVKEIFKLDRVEYKLGDFVQYLETTTDKFDVAIASGVLYHMLDPIHLLDLLARVSDRVLLWTHYYDEKIISGNERLCHKFSPLKNGKFDSFEYQWVLQSYKDSLKWNGFCGGGHETSVWLTRQSILDFLALRGFDHVSVELEAFDHPNGPSFAVIASRQPFVPQSGAIAPPVAVIRFSAQLDGAKSTKQGLEITVSLTPLGTTLPEKVTRLFIALERDGVTAMIGADGLYSLDEQEVNSVAPWRELHHIPQTLDLTLPTGADPAGITAIYFGFGNSLAEIIASNAYTRVDLRIENSTALR